MVFSWFHILSQHCKSLKKMLGTSKEKYEGTKEIHEAVSGKIFTKMKLLFVQLIHSKIGRTCTITLRGLRIILQFRIQNNVWKKALWVRNAYL